MLGHADDRAAFLQVADIPLACGAEAVRVARVQLGCTPELTDS